MENFKCKVDELKRDLVKYKNEKTYLENKIKNIKINIFDLRKEILELEKYINLEVINNNYYLKSN